MNLFWRFALAVYSFHPNRCANQIMAIALWNVSANSYVHFEHLRSSFSP